MKINVKNGKVTLTAEEFKALKSQGESKARHVVADFAEAIKRKFGEQSAMEITEAVLGMRK